MRIIARLSKAITANHAKFLNTPSIKALNREKWRSEDEKDLRGLAYLLDGVEEDKLGKLEALCNERQGQQQNDAENVPDTPFSQNPSIMPMAHLYNALKRNNYSSSTWPRMEKLIKIHTEEYIFYGDTPTDFHTCHSKTRLNKGLSANMSIPNARSTTIATTRKRRNFEDNLTPLSHLLRKRVTPHVAGDEPDLITSVNQLFIAEIKVKGKTPSNESGPLKLLQFVENSFSKDLLGIKFDY
ncbi:hypothetical protein G7Y89_g9306 [Cudoniella acicularis]|uniref:Uncharacterized protein n=1 Tax=Cudoniella acicularis TaxID=354080 RepID=A0A8H4RH51_9HELO|nr:hypothetical protein G7Y89_g9306 [Cudoniella acicularis]